MVDTDRGFVHVPGKMTIFHSYYLLWFSEKACGNEDKVRGEVMSGLVLGAPANNLPCNENSF